VAEHLPSLSATGKNRWRFQSRNRKGTVGKPSQPLPYGRDSVSSGSYYILSFVSGSSCSLPARLVHFRLVLFTQVNASS
jgi:hypothetical protein